MGATFPNGIASFKTHVDRLDAIDAADINKIQDEVVAIQETLGAALTQIQTVEAEVDVLDTEETTQQGLNRSLFQIFVNLAEMVQTLWDGKNIYAAEAHASNKNLRKTAPDRPFPPDLIQLNQPSTDDDPMAMWNGTGFTLKKSGFWVAHGQIQVNLANNGPNNNANFGTYEGSVTVNGSDWTRALDRRYPVVDQTWHDIMLTPTLAGWFPKGTKLTLRAAQSSDLAQNIHSAHLSVYRLRG